MVCSASVVPEDSGANFNHPPAGIRQSQGDVETERTRESLQFQQPIDQLRD
jgi:hypothetical protein